MIEFTINLKKIELVKLNQVQFELVMKGISW